MTGRRVSQAAVFVVLLAMSFSIPLMIQAIFPGGHGGDHASAPPEEQIVSAHAASASSETSRTNQNYAWMRGDGGSVLDGGDAAGAGADDEAVEAVVDVEVGSAEGERLSHLDVRPGVFLGYTRSWDNLEIRREQFAAGVFAYIGQRNRVQASGARLRFRDNTDRISGEAVRLDGAHLLPHAWVLQEGVEHDDYDHLHDHWNGDIRLSGAVAPKVGIEVDGGRQDVWERLTNIQDKLSLWSIGASIFYELLPRWWLAALGRAGWYSDHNAKLLAGGEAGYVVSPRMGLSVAAGIETTTFKDQEVTYWSPSYYHYVYGRIRLTKDYDHQPFAPVRPKANGWRDRLGYLAEVTAGVNDDGHPEISERAGLEVRPTGNLSLRGEFFHLDSAGRFEDSYSENRVNGVAEVRF